MNCEISSTFCGLLRIHMYVHELYISKSGAHMNSEHTLTVIYLVLLSCMIPLQCSLDTPFLYFSIVFDSMKFYKTLGYIYGLPNINSVLVGIYFY